MQLPVGHPPTPGTCIVVTVSLAEQEYTNRDALFPLVGEKEYTALSVA